MGYWVEVHCDVRKDGQSRTNILRMRCYSYMNDNPAMMLSRLSGGGKLLANVAKKQGWVRRKGQWVCPGCQ